jgi:hypothetical protein
LGWDDAAEKRRRAAGRAGIEQFHPTFEPTRARERQHCNGHSFTAHDGIQDHPFVMNFDPGQFRGARTAFGAEWYVPLVFKGVEGRPLAASGTMAWATENGYGLQIPTQPVGGGSCALTVPISDHELARIDEKRGGGESLLQLIFNVLALRPNGATAIYKPYGPLNYTIPLHRWIAMLADTGFGKIHIGDGSAGSAPRLPWGTLRSCSSSSGR